jgi:hypothetical protein
MQLKGQLLRLASYKKSQDTKIAQLQAPKLILDDVDPNIDTVMMFSSSPPTQPKEDLGSVSSKFNILGRFVATRFVQTNVEKEYWHTNKSKNK